MNENNLSDNLYSQDLSEFHTCVTHRSVVQEKGIWAVLQVLGRKCYMYNIGV